MKYLLVFRSYSHIKILICVKCFLSRCSCLYGGAAMPHFLLRWHLFYLKVFIYVFIYLLSCLWASYTVLSGRSPFVSFTPAQAPGLYFHCYLFGEAFPPSRLIAPPAPATLAGIPPFSSHLTVMTWSFLWPLVQKLLWFYFLPYP